MKPQMVETVQNRIREQAARLPALPSMPELPEMPVLSQKKAQRLATGLALFSLGLGAAEVIMPGILGRKLAMRGSSNRQLIRFFGFREIAAGLGILLGNPALGLWMRVAGDGADLATLAAAPQPYRKSTRRNVRLALVAVAGVTALDILCAGSLSKKR